METTAKLEDGRLDREGVATVATGTLYAHQAYSWCQTPAVDAVRGHFVSEL
jgi:hypothetical protein